MCAKRQEGGEEESKRESGRERESEKRWRVREKRNGVVTQQ